MVHHLKIIIIVQYDVVMYIVICDNINLRDVRNPHHEALSGDIYKSYIYINRI